jgi:inosine-uridine nucleoside N-ribohydrolase
MRPIPVILDTDIGGDIDDTWALAMLLRCPELDVKLVLTDTGDTVYRARLTAKLLQVAGRTDIPVGVGLKQKSDGPRERQKAWINDYELTQYPGKVHDDGVQALIDLIMASPEPVTLICIGPSPNIGEALRREPRIAEKARMAGMFGSFKVHHTTNRKLSVVDGRIPEWNVVKDIAAAKAIFAAPWIDATITPLDTCAYIVFDGPRYQRLRESKDPLMKAVIENYDLWSAGSKESNSKVHTSVLYDTVAVYLAFSTQHIRMQRLNVRVDDKGFTVEDPAARPVNVAMAWTNQDAFMNFLVERLLAPVTAPRKR